MDQSGFFYSFLHPEYFETLDRYQPSEELLSIVGTHVPRDWSVARRGFWTTFLPPLARMGSQGWKIHLSGTPDSVESLLERTTPVFFRRCLPFKFCSDKRMMALSLNKNWHRTAAGKAITVYPSDEPEFMSCIDELHQITRCMVGPYILTDRRYKDSSVVFYRYGSHKQLFRLSPQGHRIPSIEGKDGDLVVDERRPFHYRPSWISDPLLSGPSQSPSAPVQVFLKNGRYKITGAIRHTNTGGIYEGIDTLTGDELIVREARPFVSYSTVSIKRQADILKRLDPLGLAPRFHDFFEEGGHSFLVQERVHGQTLWTYAMSFTLAERDSHSPETLFRSIRDTLISVCVGLQEIHKRQVVLRDLTKTNVLVEQVGESTRIRFIDFEFAHDLQSSENLIPGYTTGYASPQQHRNEKPAFSDDYYALGALLLDITAFTASGLELNRAGILLALRQTLADLGQPREIADLVENLTSATAAERKDPLSVVKYLSNIGRDSLSVAKDPLMLDPSMEVPELPTSLSDDNICALLHGITSYIESSATFERSDRLWPASPQVFYTNPVGLRFGASGIASYLLRMERELDARVLPWITNKTSATTVPHGLYSGRAGVALLLANVGDYDASVHLLDGLDVFRGSDLIPGLYDGIAGIGLAYLHVWKAVGEPRLLEQASRIGRHLLGAAVPRLSGLVWESAGQLPVGLGYGASGIALFLLYLHLATDEPEYLLAGERAMWTDISAATQIQGRTYNHNDLDVPTTAPRSPHTRHGSGGVASAALRFFALTKQERYHSFAGQVAHTVMSRYTNKLWQDWGLAGFGELLLDAYRFLGDERFLSGARYVAEGILPHIIHKANGIAIPGAELLKISCDVGLGSSGVGMFLRRLQHPSETRFLFLDELIECKSSEKTPTETFRQSREHQWPKSSIIQPGMFPQT